MLGSRRRGEGLSAVMVAVLLIFGTLRAAYQLYKYVKTKSRSYLEDIEAKILNVDSET
jgi:hypothetical protein